MIRLVGFFKYIMRCMGFGELWLKWIEATVFKISMSVLVNGSPTNEFRMERGLFQSDPLSPFLFVLVVEGLRGLVARASEVQDFKGLNVKGKGIIDILLYADNTLLIGEGGWKHVWDFKMVLRGFELVSGLGDNYLKSWLISFNLNTNFLRATASFLTYRIKDKAFTFLGILIGANPRRISFWQPLVSSVAAHLAT